VAFGEYADISCMHVMSAVWQLYGIIHTCGFAVAVTVYGPVSETVKICLGKVLKVLKLVKDKRGGTLQIAVA